MINHSMLNMRMEYQYLKKDHPNGYYTQIQMAMGFSQITFCDFIVYTFDGMIIIRTQFDEDYIFLYCKN